MMLTAIALLIQAEPAVEAVPSGEVTVIGQRLRRLRLVTKKDRKTGVVTCQFKRRSGDPKLDADICNATLACLAKLPPDISRTAAVVVVRGCVKPTFDALLPRQPWRAGSD